MEIKLGTEVKSSPGQIRRYFLVSGFDTTNKTHWQNLRRTSLEQRVNPGEALIVHFMDLKQYYEPSPTGQLVGEAYMHLVIAQYVQTNEGRQLFFPDAFGNGYEEPGEAPADFGI